MTSSSSSDTNFLRIGERDHSPVDFIEIFARQFQPELLAALLHGVPAGVPAEHQRRLGHADVLRPHDLVGPPVLEHPVLVDAGFVREGVAADDRLVGLHAFARQFRQQLTRWIQLPGDDARLDRHPVGTHAGRHDDLLEGGVAGALADAVDRALDLPGARADGRERVGDGEAEVVVAMGTEDRAVGVGHPLDDRLEEAGDLVRRRVSDGVGQVDRRRAGIDDGLDDATQEIQVAARGVFGRELDVVGVAARARDGIDGRSQAGLSRHPEFCRQVQVRRRDERVNAAPRRPVPAPRRRGRCLPEHSAPAPRRPCARTARATWRTASASASDAIGNPASMMSTPSASS